MRWVVSIKAYGDLVIACNILKMINVKGERASLLAGSHHKELIEAIKPLCKIFIMEQGRDLPAIFDLKRQGIIAGIRNLLLLKVQFSKLSEDRDHFIFDKLGIREKFISDGLYRSSIEMGQENIYQDYFTYFGIEKPHIALHKSADEKVLIFPDSRLLAKELPDLLVLKISDMIIATGKRPVVVRIGQNNTHDYGKNIEVESIYGFESLVSKIKNAGSIISADSLPAHLAEYFAKPIFVFSPKANNYWLPYSSYCDGWYSQQFITIGGLEQWLTKY